MLCGTCVAGIVVAVSYILKEFQYVSQLILSLFTFYIHTIEFSKGE